MRSRPSRIRSGAGALGAPLRCRRRVPGGTDGATVSEESGHVVRVERIFAASAESGATPRTRDGTGASTSSSGHWPADSMNAGPDGDRPAGRPVLRGWRPLRGPRVALAPVGLIEPVEG